MCPCVLHFRDYTYLRVRVRIRVVLVSISVFVLHRRQVVGPNN